MLSNLTNNFKPYFSWYEYWTTSQYPYLNQVELTIKHILHKQELTGHISNYTYNHLTMREREIEENQFESNR